MLLLEYDRLSVMMISHLPIAVISHAKSITTACISTMIT